MPPHAPLRVIFLGLTLLLSGCARPMVLAFLEPAFWDAAGGAAGLGRPLERAAGGRGWKARVLLAQDKGSPAEQLEKRLSTQRIPAAILAPMLSFEGIRLANAFPGTRFILVDAYGAEDQAANTVQLQFDRRGAFRLAGAAAALSAADGSAGPAGKVGLLRMIPAGAGDFDGDAFREGAEEVSGAATVTVRELPESADRPTARRAIEQMRASGVELFLVRAGAMAPFVLETLRETGGAAVVEDWASSRFLPRQVFLSIEEDLPAGIGLCLDKGPVKSAVVYGPVRIVPGEARPVPAALRERLERGAE